MRFATSIQVADMILWQPGGEEDDPNPSNEEDDHDFGHKKQCDGNPGGDDVDFPDSVDEEKEESAADENDEYTEECLFDLDDTLKEDEYAKDSVTRPDD
ncbi:hypothetical protein O3M35_013125 [Rhynocoris fuscipes]|uniref:Uncharacterized protein n=1 Tax=Rhynocoris fuscipes TaxID=488301 RepID=A0AAW1CF35_9HEMI